MNEVQNNYRFKTTGEKFMRAAVAVVENQDNELILIKRSIRKGDPWSGHIGFPGGRGEEIDYGNPLQTAMRETFEEIGLELSEDEFIEELPPIITEKEMKGIRLELRPYKFKLGLKPCLVLDPNEVQEVILLPMEEVINGTKTENGNFILVDGQTHELPFLPLPDGNKVWGLTLKILQGLSRR